jgi:Flp pilus assembly protein TadB
VICSFLDLVVLGLGGGMGIESALFTAAQLGENAMSRRLVAELSLCRDAGEPPWEALERLGDALGIDELCELAATARLAGTEGARVRTTLAARAASIRRHELANEEAEANALTEKLFVPGAFLLVGFLLFIGYPAFTRITSGF